MSSEQSLTETPVQQGAPASGGEQSDGSGGYELDEDGHRVPHGMGQSKSSRRRRRKRKNKGPEAGSGQPGGSTESQPGGEPAGEAAGSQVIGSMQAGAAQDGDQSAPPQSSHRNAGPGLRQGREGRGSQGREQSNYSQQGSGVQPNGAQQGSGGAPGGTKRWKKKFRDRDRTQTGGGQQSAGSGGSGFSQNGGSSQNHSGGSQSNSGGGFRGPDTHQPGNGGGFKRKGGFGTGGGGGRQQRTSRGFVGPMDHSYRAVNGNFPETPPSTIEPHGSHGGGGGRQRTYQGDSQPIDYSQGRAIPIAEGAPTKIYFFIEDLFFTAKIQETARKLGVKIAFMKNDKESIAALTSSEEVDRPGLIVFDLNNANAKPLTLIPKLKAKLKKSTSIVGFLSHLQGDLKAKAVEVGCDTVMPRAAFSQNLPNLLRRYGIEDTDEPNYNQ